MNENSNQNEYAETFSDFTYKTILSPNILKNYIEPWKMLAFPYVYIDIGKTSEGNNNSRYVLEFPNINDYHAERKFKEYFNRNNIEDAQEHDYFVSHKENLNRYLKDDKGGNG